MNHLAHRYKFGGKTRAERIVKVRLPFPPLLGLLPRLESSRLVGANRQRKALAGLQNPYRVFKTD